MKGYDGWERTVAKKLDSFPAIRRLAKTAYQRLNYWIHREGVQCRLHPQARLRGVLDSSSSEQGDPHFFGYYDKTPWSPDAESMLMHRLRDGEAEILCINVQTGRSQSLGSSSAWNYQQGSMAQWLDNRLVAYNDVREGKLGVCITRIDKEATSFIPWPVQTVHPTGNEALSLNYKRLLKSRSEYGYSEDVRNFSGELSPKDDGIWRVDLELGTAGLILSLERLRSHRPRPEMDGAQHWVNHAMYSPGGTQFVFMHRWVGKEGRFSRLYVAESERKSQNTELSLLMDDRMVSHYSWRDDNHLLVWGRTEEHGDRYYLLDVRDGTYRVLGPGTFDQFGDGHPSYAPGGRWVVTDTYPDKARQRHLLLFDTQTETVVHLGQFFAPWAFEGEKRCDLHPRWSPSGNHISIDSAHEGVRMSYTVDVREVLTDYE